MPFEIVRNDIVNMQVDAIVNTANPNPVVGYGVDAGVNKKAGPELLEARKQIGRIALGCAAVTPAFGLDARYVIHAVGPVWQGGSRGEEQILRKCYDSALQAAVEHRCESVAFPLMSAGSLGFPKPVALRVAIAAFSEFLMEHEMQIYLVVFGKDTVLLTEKLFHTIDSYIDEKYIQNKSLDEYGVEDRWDLRAAEMEKHRRMERRRLAAQKWEEEMRPMAAEALSADVAASIPVVDWDSLLEETDAGFSETLLKLIDRSGKKDSEIYKKANVDRKLFSKIRNNPQYKPSKVTAVAFALALELNLEETQRLLGRAGYALTHSSKFDIIVEHFIFRRQYNILEIDAVLFHYDLPLIGAE